MIYSMREFIETFEMPLDPRMIHGGYIVTTPIIIGVSFNHNEFNEVSNINVICKMDLVSVIKWDRVRILMTDAIVDMMRDIKERKKRGEYV